MRKRWLVLGALGVFAIFLFVQNASLFAQPSGQLTLLSHRGVHQDYSRQGLGRDDCTATRIYAPANGFIENTIPSIRAAFAAGAGMVEIDIQPTVDGEFVVFHDWTLDCRTNGHGVTRERTWAEMRGLDIGYGYTADGGRTFPFRGRGVGMMPRLRDVLAAFPDQRFLINFKSDYADEADMLLGYLDTVPQANLQRLAFYGAGPADRMRLLRPQLRSVSRHSLMQCAKSYMLTGWYGNIPAPCRNTIIFVPYNYGWVAWGWPDRFLARMQSAGSEVYVVDALRRGETPGVGGIDDAAGFAQVPNGWRGGVATDRIEVIGPLASARP